MVGGEINAGDNPPSLLRCPGVVQFGLTSNLLDLGRRSALWRIVALHQCDIARLIHIYVIMLNEFLRPVPICGAAQHGGREVPRSSSGRSASRPARNRGARPVATGRGRRHLRSPFLHCPKKIPVISPFNP